MMKKRKFILLFILVLPLVLSLSNIQLGAQDNYNLTYFEAGVMQGSLDGSNITNPEYCPPDGPCAPMVGVAAWYIMDGAPTDNGNGTFTFPANARTFESSALCLGEGNPYIVSSGRLVYVCYSDIYSFCTKCGTCN